MGHSLNPTLEEEISDALDYLIINEDVIISDLKIEYGPRIKKGFDIHKGFKRQEFIKGITSLIKSRIKDLYTFDKRWYITSEMVMLIKADNNIKELTNKIIEEVLNE